LKTGASSTPYRTGPSPRSLESVPFEPGPFSRFSLVAPFLSWPLVSPFLSAIHRLPCRATAQGTRSTSTTLHQWPQS
jgi:hypothetical protein